MNIDSQIEWVRLEKVLNEYGEYLVKTLRRKMKDNGSNASYALSNSFEYEVGIKDNANSTRYYVAVTMESYWKYVNKGRQPGRIPNIGKIEEWIRVKPIVAEPRVPTVKSLAIAIRNSIKNKKGYAPPRRVLEDWINKKGISSFEARVPSIRSLAWAIAMSIAKKGTTGTFFWDEAVEETNNKYKDKIDEAIMEDIAEWVDKIIQGTIEMAL